MLHYKLLFTKTYGTTDRNEEMPADGVLPLYSLMGLNVTSSILFCHSRTPVVWDFICVDQDGEFRISVDISFRCLIVEYSTNRDQ